jgi:uncharacterized protein YgiM (DUF1202 family)
VYQNRFLGSETHLESHVSQAQEKDPPNSLKLEEFINTNTQIYVEYLGEYVSMSIMLELAVLNKREREKSGHTRVLNK